MADLLIRDVPEHVVAAIDARARRLGLSRSAYVRRQLAREITVDQAVTIDDLARFAERFADLGDEDVMAQAWR